MNLILRQTAFFIAVSFGLCLSACDQDVVDTDIEHTSVQMITDWTGTQNAPLISPNGNFVAFDEAVDGNADIYIRDLTSGVTQRVTQHSGSDRRPVWSPDGRSIAFVSNRDDQLGIWTIDKDGSNPKALYLLESGFRLSGRPMWSPDGARIAFTLIDPSGDGNITWGRATVATIDVESGALNEHTTSGDEWWPAWGPNSFWLYYYVGISDDIEAVNVATGDIRSVSNGNYVGWQPMVSPDGQSIVFISSIDRPSVFVAPINGSHAPIRITKAGDDGLPSFSPDGKSIIFTSDQTPSPIVEYSLSTGQRTILADNGRQPQELADGQIAHLTPGMATWDVILRASDETSSILKTDISPIIEFTYSPNGENIAVVTSNDLMNDYHIQILDKNGASTGTVLDEHGKPETPVWCDDNKTLLFSARENWDDGIRHTWAYNIKTNAVSRITDSAINTRPTQCTDNGQRITYFQTMNGSGIRSVEKNGDDWVTTLSFDGSAGRWSPDGSVFAFTARRNGQTDIFIRNATGEETQITNDALSESAPTWSSDGQRLLFSVSEPNRNIWMATLPELPWNE